MSALHRLFANNPSKAALPVELEAAVNEVLREAEELCRLLRSQRDRGTPRTIEAQD